MKTALFIGLLAIVAALALSIRTLRPGEPVDAYVLPREGIITQFAAPDGEARVLTIEAATDVRFMRPFIEQFQRAHATTRVVYADFLSSELLRRASEACKARRAMPDLYLSISTDHLVQLANYGCASDVPSAVAGKVPEWARWREVIAFTIEPAVMVYNTRLLPPEQVPRSHQALIETLRGDGRDWTGKVGTYDIEKSGAGYNYAVFDARQSAIHGRLIESFGRIAVRTYCCSQDMVDAVARGEILLAYNVQMSYGHAAQRAGESIGVVLPSDYQAVQTRSVMLARNGQNRADAIAFVDSLVAPPGQQLARALLQPLEGATASGEMLSTRMLAEVAVGPALLASRDDARRARFIKEWTQAVKTPPSESARD